MNDYLCAIDIGSTLVRVMIARSDYAGGWEVLGVGTSPSGGVRAGNIVNIEQTTRAVSEAAREAELMSGLVVDHALVNITGKHLEGDNSRGVVAITNRDRVVRESDVLRVIEGAQNIRIPTDHEIIHVLAREFMVEDQGGIKDPVGMTGVRLEAMVHIVSAGATALANLEKAVLGAGIRLGSVVMSSLASGESVLSEGEKDLGAIVLDIGGGITDIVMYSEGGVCFSAVVPLGGLHVTQDLSIGLKIPVEAAEMVKKAQGCALSSFCDPTERVELPGIPGRAPRAVLRQEMSDIIEARLREIFELADQQLSRSGLKGQMAAGIVLTGGVCLLEGARELAEEVFGLAANVASPSGLSGFAERVSGPEFATLVGLVRYAGRMAGVEQRAPALARAGGPSGGLITRMKHWISENL